MTILSEELSVDELNRGYSGMTDVQTHADLHTEYRTRTKASMSGDELFVNTDPEEFAGLSDHKQLAWISWTSKDAIDPGDQANEKFVKWIFGHTEASPSTTVSNLATARVENISRAVELGIPGVRLREVIRTRREM